MRSHRHHIGGLAAMLLGAVLFLTGIVDASRPAAERSRNPLISRFANAPMMCIGGGVSATLGLFGIALSRATSVAAQTNLSQIYRRTNRMEGKK